jgi:hypothetical protein
MTQKALITTLFLAIFLVSFAAASFDSGWIDFRDNSNYVVCGDKYPSCNLNSLGLDWFSQNSGDTYQIICGESAAPTGCLLWDGAGLGKTYNVPTAGNYYLFFSAVYESSSSGNDETMRGGITSNFGTWGREVTDLGAGDKSCVFRNTFTITNQNKVWLQGTGGSVNPYSFRLTECIPEEAGLVYCDDGAPVTATCGGTDHEDEEPIVTIQSPVNNTTYNTHAIIVNATADQTIDTWSYELNGGSISPLFNGATYTFSEGCHELIVYGENTNGTGNDTVSFCVNLSTPINPEAPNVTIVFPNDGETYNTTLVMVNATADQTIENWTFNVDGGIFNDFVPGNSYNLTEGCHDLIVLGANVNGTGSDTVNFCIDLGGDDPEDPEDEPCDDDEDDDEEDVNPYALGDQILDIILNRNRDSVVLGAGGNEDTGKFNIYPVLVGLLLLGIIIILILILLLGSGKEKKDNSHSTESLY